MSPTIVLITGANQGLGYFTALQLAQQPGYHIIIGSRDASKGADAVEKIKSDGAQSAVETIQLDVDSDASIDAAVKTVKEKFGKLDVLVVRLRPCAYEPGRPSDQSSRTTPHIAPTANLRPNLSRSVRT
jgi:NAD(P)-dependent dehydrogenase (short-subunit alcohol dehydrogenase family)